jgi:hypothetical protein
MNFSTRIKLLAGSSAIFFGLLLFMAGCSQNKTPTTPTPPVAPPVTPANVTAVFLGDAACKDCHASEFSRHAVSAHAATMKFADKAGLDKLAPPIGRIPTTDIVVGIAGDKFQVGLEGVKDYFLPLTVALGSGKTGMTYVALLDDDRIIEIRKSYFPRSHSWYTTPGHIKNKPKTVGIVYTRNQAAACLMCHVVTLPDDSNKMEKKFLGVGCESCHGAGSLHLEAAKAGRTADLKMENLGALSATKLNDLCGRCHRTVENIAATTGGTRAARITKTNRFQPYGLMTSQCFIKSGSKISCLNCHDPHSDAGTDHKVYEAACLKCHAPVKAQPLAAGVVSGKLCLVNPKTGCIPCHMPKRPAFDDKEFPAQMADHRIAIHRELKTN